MKKNNCPLSPYTEVESFQKNPFRAEVESKESPNETLEQTREAVRNKDNQERVFIIQPIFSSEYRALHDEAVELIESAGASYAGSIYQEIREINPATIIGSGKLKELNEMLSGLEGITILFNGELSPSQTLNISAALDNRKVIDRTTLILDIFARNAVSTEGKLQVELSQLKYIYPRLKGKGEALSRLGGGIGTRGPGETQLESDRRLIRERIKLLEKRLTETEKRRVLQRERREKNATATISLVGYTNTGKSTLMNALTSAEVFVKNELFATLDPTSRKLSLDGAEFILTDTVGFLRELPHSLIESFRSTLEAGIYCDLALIVCDATSDYEMQLSTTLTTLHEMGFSAPYLIVMNKSENLERRIGYPKDSVFISAKYGLGLDDLKRAILEKFNEKYHFETLFIPYGKISEYTKLKNRLTENKVTFLDEGIEVQAVIPAESYPIFRPFLTSQ